jgi:hypothetical protein
MSMATDRDPAVGYRGVIAPADLQMMGPKEQAALCHRHRGFGRRVQWDIQLFDSNQREDSRPVTA